MDLFKNVRNCINLGQEFRDERDQSVKMLLQGNRHVANLMQCNFVTKEDFEEDGHLHYIKKRLETHSEVFCNIELFCLFGGKIDVCILRPRHYLMLTNYIRQLCDLPMMYCCDNANVCSLRNQIHVYNEQLIKHV